ncbi:interferon-induced 35 kDa protein isoform X1 [Notechis scutatus]|uniref:Interferon-induced 35 kDa protein isoform X1 n=1 Tax=Notechis scutatus TaxID=8663 RepID=A0A6J1VTZ0_9SAUR|nr:interferon-induced 35 kDa protein isoform X1 [Notechis scutatus]XP_026543425.1 interferon-induced 35 kDa protein isoform X1 [Notechis scutatus]
MDLTTEEGCEASCDPRESFIHLASGSLVASGSWKMTKVQIINEIKKCQDIWKAFEGDCLSLKANTMASEQDLIKFQEEYELLSQNLLEAENEAQAQEATFQEILQLEKKNSNQLMQEKQALENELNYLEQLGAAQKEILKAPAALPGREMVFKGHVEEGEMENLPEMLTFLPQIRYPVFGGSALITFEDPEVARRIIQIRQHCIQLDEWSYMHVKAEAVTLLLPSFLKEMSLKQSSQQVLLSGLSAFSLPKDQLYDKLVLFFSKRKNQGGEVDRLEQLPNSDDVVLTFVDDGVAQRIVEKGLFQVLLGKEMHQIKASHCLRGEIADLQLYPSVCARTVLLTEIPDVLGRELMCEALEIHFQKQSKGGGEVESAVYIPAGRYAVAIFEEED